MNPVEDAMVILWVIGMLQGLVMGFAFGKAQTYWHIRNLRKIHGGTK